MIAPRPQFSDAKIYGEIRTGSPYGGDKCRWGGLKLVTFDEKHATTPKRYKIDV